VSQSQENHEFENQIWQKKIGKQNKLSAATKPWRI
jgi:hypothetical protein